MAARMTRREFGVVAIGIAVAGPRAGAMNMSTNLERFKAIVERGFSHGDLTVAAPRRSSSMSIFREPTFPVRKS